MDELSPPEATRKSDIISPGKLERSETPEFTDQLETAETERNNLAAIIKQLGGLSEWF